MFTFNEELLPAGWQRSDKRAVILEGLCQDLLAGSEALYQQADTARNEKKNLSEYSLTLLAAEKIVRIYLEIPGSLHPNSFNYSSGLIIKRAVAEAIKVTSINYFVPLGPDTAYYSANVSGWLIEDLNETSGSKTRARDSRVSQTGDVFGAVEVIAGHQVWLFGAAGLVSDEDQLKRTRICAGQLRDIFKLISSTPT